MKERPIIFSGEMVRAILAGKKTQTRRVMKPQPDCTGVTMLTAGGDFVYIWPHEIDGEVRTYYSKFPYGVPGDRLWVRETWRELIDLGVSTNSSSNYVDYRADNKTDWNPDVKWRPSIFMPRWASRLTLEIIAVKVERLLDIRRDDAFREGIEAINPYQLPGMADVKTPLPAAFRDYQDADNCFFGDPIPSFYTLWDSIYAGRGYPAQENPWVWVIEFKKVEP